MESSKKIPGVEPETPAPAAGPAGTSWRNGGRALRIDPDLEFIQALREQVGDKFLICMQCGTCAATCALSPDDQAFPRKEMIWAGWGLKDRLMVDPDVWLCYNCQDCSTGCPRGARPGDVLAAVRQQVALHHAAPRFMGSIVNRCRYIPLLVGTPLALLGAGLLWKDQLGAALGLTAGTGEPIVFSYSSAFPHWFLNGLFLLLGGLVLIAGLVGAVRYWRALKASPWAPAPVKGRWESVRGTLRRILGHDDFAACTTMAWRYLAHLGVFFGFVSLSVVTLWIITNGINPLLRDGFAYPWGIASPWKILANAGGLALLLGCLGMIIDRLAEGGHRGANTYYQWSLVVLVLAVLVTGFATELLHFLRLEPHRHIVYFAHLVLVFVLLATLPYSKFAHVIYRSTALIFAERTGRRATASPDRGGQP